MEADILSYNRMACRTPEGLSLQVHRPEVWPVDVPIAVALTSDTFEPWTETSHKFRFYQQPSITKIEPEKISVGEIKEVVVTIEDDPELPENVFFEPMPVRMVHDSDEDEDGTYMATMGSFRQLKCSFGRFGDTDAVFVDERTVKCATPSVDEDPNDIYQEEVSFSVTMNGMTFPEEGGEGTVPFTFEGTGEASGLLPIVLFILALGLLVAAVIIWFNDWFNLQSLRNRGQ